MKKIIPILFLLAVVLPLSACGDNPAGNSRRSGRDVEPPLLTDYALLTPSRLVLEFDEAAQIPATSLALDPPAGSGTMELLQSSANRVTVEFPGDCLPGVPYRLRFDGVDGKGNTNWFILEFYGLNENLPTMLLSEVSPNGSSSRPDMVELYVKHPGNTAGMTLLVGVEGEEKGCYFFPEMDVGEGEYIIFHCRPEGITEEVSETGMDLSLSGGLRAQEGIRDLWAPEIISLPGTSAVISLLSSPRKGSVMDRIVYTNRVNEGEDDNWGWTATLWKQIVLIMSDEPGARGWQYGGDIFYPGDAVWSDDSTSTRTLCRSSDLTDEDRAEDWHTVPTSGSSFGYPNSDEVYDPDS